MNINLPVLKIGQKYATVKERVYHVEGDERSRQSPGHGYPAHDDKFNEIKIYDNPRELETYLTMREHELRLGQVKIIIVQDVVIDVTVLVSAKV